MKNNWAYIAYGLAWLSTGIAVSIAVWVTKNPACLWAFLIPSFISLSSKG